jgi:hypothetical protein
MNLRKLAVSFILVFLFTSQAIAQIDISGTWQARYMLTDITVHVEHVNDTLSGFLIVHDSQKNDIYHFTGTIKENTIQARHGDGHAFTGRLTSDVRIVGTLTTNQGVTIQLTMTRT